MEKTPMYKKVAAFAIALALTAGTFTALGAPQAQAESGSSQETLSASQAHEKLIQLLTQLLALLQSRSFDQNDNDSNDDDDDNNDDDSCDDTGLSELEADIFTNETVIQIELDGNKDVLVTEADTRAEIIDVILEEYESLSEDEVDDLLEVETEDRASRASDKDWADGDNNSCDDEDGDDEDDNRGHGNDDDRDDDDNRGHGNNHDDDDEDEDDD
jgi:hypothetical protein